VLLAVGCGPPQSLVREYDAEAVGGATGQGGNGGRGGTGGMQSGGGSGGSGGQGGSMPSPDAPVVTNPDTAPAMDTAAPPDMRVDAAVDQAPPTPDMATPDVAPDTGGQGKTVLMVVGYPTLMQAGWVGDLKMKTRLEGRGFTVKIGDDDGAVDQATGTNLVIITESAGTQVAAKYTALNLPVICMEPQLYDDLKMTGGTGNTDLGTTGNVSQIAITMMDHPLAGGLTGNVTVASSGQNAAWGLPGAMAARVATLVGMANRVAVFGYTQGTTMVGMAAPAKRVGLPMSDGMVNALTDMGWTLFDAAIDWALQ
jgi:hypothetical protein